MADAEDDDDWDPLRDPADDPVADDPPPQAMKVTATMAEEKPPSFAEVFEALNIKKPPAQEVQQAVVSEQPLVEGEQRRTYDIVVYGATGYTGCLVAEHLDSLFSEPGAKTHKWALAGRSREKLERLAANCKTASGICVASTEEGLSEMASSCSVLINCVGPFLVHGPAVVAACVEQGTHYVDVSGEVAFAKRIIDSHDKAARERGVKIVPYCAYDAGVFDIGGYLLAKRLGPLTQLREYYIVHPIPVKGGPSLSGLALLQHASWSEIQNVSENPFSLGGERECGVRDDDKDPSASKEDPLYPGAIWLARGAFAPVTTRNVRRTVELFEQTPAAKLQYGKSICVMGHDACQSKGQVRTRTNTTARTLLNPEQQQLQANATEEYIKSGAGGTPGMGPGRNMRAAIHSESFFVAQGEDDNWAHVHYQGPEVSEVTALVVVTGALVLVEELESLLPLGGVLTPAFAFHGSTWIERVVKRSFACATGGEAMRFQVADGKPLQEDLVKAIKAANEAVSAYGRQMALGTLPNGGNEEPEMLMLKQ
mmetsp:Transcript_120563/g.257474  ORF Transcript_120563/g.257474 Transcript_120563/m.257474 type:complete len:539 (+) Transcript_120563:66-1682(+)|eukprot:CAMPEP_0180423150 /NCGR_PEP_ID=MMETSP1036_2-20121128/4061_1 /TAXON_ID=632150 /ORGANISM="Azadinium spinosum, Strain 3D9" /LENGTH=538 /DNA_ID=CAMNT_0022428523 /DNA_START=66 /DNA_END=1682 /DNA_ORIENTATION=+